MEKNILIVDFGFGYTKSIFKQKKIKIPSLVSNYIPKKESLVSTIQVTPIQMDDLFYLFGNDVNIIESKFKIYSRNIDFIINFYPLAIQSSISKIGITPEKIEYLAIGLPPENLNLENAEKLKERITNVKINKKRFPWTKSRIFIFAQGQGAFVDAKKQLKKEIKADSGFLLDIGYNTLLAIPFKEGKILPQYKQYDRFGVSGIIDEFFNPLIISKYEIKLDRNEINEVFKTGILHLGPGNKINVENEIKTAVKMYITAIQSQLEEDFRKEIPKAEKFIIAGGGSYRIKDHLDPSWKKILKVIEEPEFSNARGYQIMAQNRINLN